MFGDFIIEAWIEKDVAEKVDTLFKEAESFNEEFRTKLQEIVGKKSKTKITISLNKRKADKLKKKFGKYFYIKK